MLDLKITGGTIIDGTGSPGFAGDVGIRDGRIVAVGQVDEEAREEIDASGRVVSPGFIDSHTHYDAQAFWEPTLSPSCYHGVTTVVGGFCGFSIAPLTAESAPYIQRMLARVEGMPLETLEVAADWSWSSFGDFLDRIEGRIGLNAGFFAGHSAIRRAVMGERAVGEKATGEDIERMQALLDESLAAGALGFSTTVSPTHNDYEGQPVPSRWAEREEFLALASVVKDHEGTGLELLPNIDFPEGTPELMVDFSVAGQRPVNWNVLVVPGSPDAASMVEEKLAISDMARERGGEVIALTVPCMPKPYMSLRTGMGFEAMPGYWREVFSEPVDVRIGMLQAPEVRARLAQDIGDIPDGSAMKMFASFAGYTVVSVQAEANRPYEGRTIGEIAAEDGRQPIELVFDIGVADGLETVFAPNMGGEDHATYEIRGKIWKDDRTLVGASDAGAHLDILDTFAFSTIMLQRGVREHRVIGLEEAVHQITSRQAAYFGLVDRGEIRVGNHADIVVFDPETVGCGPTHKRYDLPGGNEYRLYAEAEGIDHVLVNGVEIVRHGEHTGKLPGQLLRSGRDTRTVPMNILQAEAA